MRVLTFLLMMSASSVSLADPLPSPDSCTDELATYMDAVVSGGKREAYLCLAVRDDAPDALMARMAELPEDDQSGVRLSRALAIHMMQHLDKPITAERARALLPVDRRLMRDAIQARRGRATPVEENKAVFAQFDWYQPSEAFHPGMLTELDHQNMKMVDKPPEAPKPEKEASAAEAVAEAQQADAPPPAEGTGVETWCGCQAPVGAWGLAWIVGVGLAAGRRRRR